MKIIIICGIKMNVIYMLIENSRVDENRRWGLPPRNKYYYLVGDGRCPPTPNRKLGFWSKPKSQVPILLWVLKEITIYYYIQMSKPWMKDVKRLSYITAPYTAKRTYSVKRRPTYRKRYNKSIEFKTIDVALDVVSDSTGSITLLNGLIRGTDYTNRIGRKVTLRSIEIKGQNYVTPGTGVDQNQRVLIVHDRDPTGVLPAITDILTAVTPVALRNLDNRTRFNILLDKRFQLNATAESMSTRLWKYYKRFYKMMDFNGNNFGDIRDITQGAIYYVSLGNKAAGVTAGSSLANVRIRYTDN